MKTDVTVISTQRIDGESVTETVKTVGEWEVTPRGMRLTYTEPADGAQTSIQLMGKRVHVRRKGECVAHWVLEEGTAHSCPYQTPYGTLPFTITTNQIHNQLQPNGGRLFLSYQLDAGSGVTELDIEILIKEVS